ncbi:MAG: ATP-binding protein [Myxococcota bacterium]
MRCAACSFENPPGMRFCGGCGQRLEQAEAERRQVTVLFCDLVGSTSLSDRLDPEDLCEVIRDYQDHVAACVERFEGHVAQFLGDGVLVYFGYPQAHEDDAVRAMHAGLAILAGLDALNARLRDRDVQVALRLGVHTGPVVAGTLGTGTAKEALALGVVPNVAARIEGLADDDTLLMSADTHRMIRHRFICEDLGPRRLKGISALVDVYRLVREREPSDASVVPGSDAPLRGRVEEAERLRAAYRRVAQGGREALLLEGEPGIGKTRLLGELHGELGDEALWLACTCSAFATTSALYPVVSMLARTFEIQRSGAPEARLAALEQGLRGFGPRAPDVLPLFGELLSIPQDPTHPTLDVGPDLKRQRTFEAIRELIGPWSAERPGVVAVEDLHWADPSTLEFIGGIAAQGPERVLLVSTARTPFEPAWIDAVERVSLRGLPTDRLVELVRDAAGDVRLAPEVLRYVAARTDGTPLFARELTAAILESGALREGSAGLEFAGDASARLIPTTLRGSLTARIDRLPDARPVAQLAATIGREFSYAILSAVADLPEATLRRSLDQLVAAEILDRHGEPSERYEFRHALIQEAAYELLLKRVRREHHAKIARALVERFPERVEVQPELVARHYTEAGQPAEAIRYWRLAGERAGRQSATAEAIAHLEAGLGLLAGQPATPERDGEELAFQIALGAASLPTRGFAAPEVERIYLRAGELSRRVGRAPEQFWAMQGLRIYHLVRAELEETQRIAGAMLEMAADSGDPVHDASARLNYGSTCFYQGEFQESLEWLEQAMESAPPDDRTLRDNLRVDMAASCLAYAALVLWHLGDLERSEAYGDRALEVARATDHASSLTQTMVFAGCQLSHFRRDTERCRRMASELLVLAQERGFLIWQLQATLFEGASRAKQLPEEELDGFGPSAEAMAGTLALYRASGSRLALAFLSSVWAETLIRLGRADEAAKLLDDSLAISDMTGDRMWEAEQRRLRGSISEQAGEVGAAENAYRAALATARRQGSRSLALRAAVSLARLLRARGDAAEGDRLLREACDAFDPDADGVDLREARALLG